MGILIRFLLIIGMALYSFNAYGEINKVKKGIQPVTPKKPKKSKSQKALEQDEHEREHECEKEKMICEANNG
jgi:hypothetical protein